MLRTLLLWHLIATAVMLVVYLVVAGLQWSAARLPGLVDVVRRRAAERPEVAVPVARREDDAGPLTKTA